MVGLLKYFEVGRTNSARSVGERSPILALGAEAYRTRGGLIAGPAVTTKTTHSC
jgi:hypothetical protein